MGLHIHVCESVVKTLLSQLNCCAFAMYLCILFSLVEFILYYIVYIYLVDRWFCRFCALYVCLYSNCSAFAVVIVVSRLSVCRNSCAFDHAIQFFLYIFYIMCTDMKTPKYFGMPSLEEST